MGPSLGPAVAGFSVTAENWRWSSWELLWATGPVFLFMFCFLPETSASTILLRRARRLRKLTGDQNISTQSEIAQKDMHAKAVAFDALIKPWEINALDPAVAFTTLYTALAYGTFYSFFEAVPLVYPIIYGFNIGETSLMFMSVIVALFVCGPLYCLYYYVTVDRHFKTRGLGVPENRLKPALLGCFLIPIAQFIFGMFLIYEYVPSKQQSFMMLD
jgi:DHA1 family multidrug resistance protein-like MFS transporter